MKRARTPTWSTLVAVTALIATTSCADEQSREIAAEATSEATAATQPMETTSDPTPLVSEPTDAGTVTLSGSDCTLEASQPFPGIGEFAIQVINERDNPSGVDLWGPITGDHGYADFAEHMEEEVRLTMAGEDFIGPPSWFGGLSRAEPILPGETATIVGFAFSGVYGLVCIGESAAWADWRVFAYDGPIEISEPPPTVVLTEGSCRFYGPKVLPAGSVTIDLINETNGRFDLDLWRYDQEGRQSEFVTHINQERHRLESGQAAMGPPSYVTLAGEATAGSREASELGSNLAEGSYAIVCVQFADDEPVEMWRPINLEVGG